MPDRVGKCLLQRYLIAQEGQKFMHESTPQSSLLISMENGMLNIGKSKSACSPSCYIYVATVKCTSDYDNSGNAYNCLHT